MAGSNIILVPELKYKAGLQPMMEKMAEKLQVANFFIFTTFDSCFESKVQDFKRESNYFELIKPKDLRDYSNYKQ